MRFHLDYWKKCWIAPMHAYLLFTWYISLTSTCCKTLEHIIYSFISIPTSPIATSLALTNMVSGRSHDTQLLKVINDFHHCLDAGNYIDALWKLLSTNRSHGTEMVWGTCLTMVSSSVIAKAKLSWLLSISLLLWSFYQIFDINLFFTQYNDTLGSLSNLFL